MKTPPHSLRRHRSGFTLVEVTLAIAVAMIGIVAVLGLLPQGMQSARSAVDNTITATIAENIFSQLRVGSFANNVICKDANCTGTLAFHLNVSEAGSLNYDQSGLPTNTNGGLSYYLVNLTATNTPGNANLTLVQATIVWPAYTKSPPNTNIFTTAITWYDNP